MRGKKGLWGVGTHLRSFSCVDNVAQPPFGRSVMCNKVLRRTAGIVSQCVQTDTNTVTQTDLKVKTTLKAT